jgi:hypothetical protein
MMNRVNGEFLVDVGFSFNPVNEEPLTGFWRLDFLERSYNAAGFNMGNTFLSNTMGWFGGKQAHISAERARRTHISFRNTYGTVYEATRNKDNDPWFAEDGDGYHYNENFLKSVESRLEIYKGQARSNAYGVRDEYRLGIQAGKKVLSDAPSLVTDQP